MDNYFVNELSYLAILLRILGNFFRLKTETGNRRRNFDEPRFLTSRRAVRIYTERIYLTSRQLSTVSVTVAFPLLRR